MESESPVNGLEDGSLSGILFEVPNDGGRGNHEHLHSVDESVYPDTHEYVVNQSVTKIIKDYRVF
jgi:hypothetical protein